MIWFWWWVLFLVVLFLLPLGYGVGYRRWGAPYPSYYRRRLLQRDASYAETDDWGVLGDVVWIAFVFALVWLFFAAL
ncbi:MAG: hypothetical protein KY443_01200 [Actinobacteria bacterium]|nr:hypothetical protein [Actinomycetota bacterium]